MIKKDFLNNIGIVSTIGMLESLSKRLEKKENVLGNEPIMFTNPYAKLATIDTEKKRTKPCKRHEYVNNVCRHCSHPLK